MYKVIQVPRTRRLVSWTHALQRRFGLTNVISQEPEFLTTSAPIAEPPVIDFMVAEAPAPELDIVYSPDPISSDIADPAPEVFEDVVSAPPLPTTDSTKTWFRN